MFASLAPVAERVPAPASALGLAARARAALVEAARESDAGERFRLAHLGALRAAAAVTAQRARPGRHRLQSVWVLLDRTAPQYAEWSAYFAAGAPLRAAVEAGAVSAVTARAADDQLRAATEFTALVEQSLGLLAA